ncbi:MAG: dihydrofolate reductase family protein [Solirubrobacteraceae bacterium]|jgi:riboflavin biosynthesis pyrimidine reductase
MNVPVNQKPDREGEQPPLLSRLLPPGEQGSIEEIIEEWGLWQRPGAPQERRHMMLNMIATVDGRASLGGRSGPLSDRADRALFHGLRSAVDAVLVGAATLRTERYGRIIPDVSRRQRRAQRGLSEEPLACIVSGRMTISRDIPLLAEPAARVVVLTASQASLPATAAHVEYVRAARDGQLDLAAAIAELHERYGVQSLLCEGGPHLARQLLGAGLIDELFLSVAPMLAGGEPAGGEALRILAGEELTPPVTLELRSVLQSGSELFLRYGVCA